MCEGIENSTELGEEVMGIVYPGDVVYYNLLLLSGNAGDWGRGIYVEFGLKPHDGGKTGHACVVAKMNGYPTLVDHDYRFTTSQAFVGSTVFRIDQQDIRSGTLIFAVFNIDYFKHSGFR